MVEVRKGSIQRLSQKWGGGDKETLLNTHLILFLPPRGITLGSAAHSLSHVEKEEDKEVEKVRETEKMRVRDREWNSI